MSSNEHSLNFENLINEVKQEISDKGYTGDDDVSFSDMQEKVLFGFIKHSNYLEENIYALQKHFEVELYRKFKSKGFIGYLTIPVKRVIRKLVSPYIEPIFADQNAVNYLFVKSITDLHFNINALNKRINQLEEENMILKSEKNSMAEGD